MNTLTRSNALAVIAAIACIAASPQTHAEDKVAAKAAKERLVLMPLRVSAEDATSQGAMETALAQGLQDKYEVFSGEQVAQKAREIFLKESHSSAKKDCDETRCMQEIAEAFQAELISTANVSKREDGYLLALSIRNIFDNKVVYSNSVPCKNCDIYQVVDKLKELSGAPATGAKAAIKTFRDCAECPEMVLLPAGNFIMGSNDGADPEKPAHLVAIAKPFALGVTEVTQAQWQAIMGSQPSEFKKCGDNCPVEKVSWNDAQVFVKKISAKTGKQYRLPSEAEWEYACRAGSQHKYCGSDEADSVAWFGAKATPPGNSGKATNPVATRQANAFGLFDMSGNVWEWIEDSYHDNYKGAPVDGTAWKGYGAKHALRGGSWYHGEPFLLTTARGSFDAGSHNGSFGFRVARTVQ